MESFCSPSRNVESPASQITENECSESPSKTDSSILSALTNQFVSEASNIPKRLYCPFCLFDFGFDFLLKSHIRDLHELEIRKFSESKLDSFTFDPCSFCHAKFYARGILPKHIIRRHQETILPLISTVNATKIFCCKFCPHKVLPKQLKLLYIHVENKHLIDFVKVLTDYNLRVNNAIAETDQSIDEVLNEEIQKLNIASNSAHPCKTIENLKPILKRGMLTQDKEEIHMADQTWAPQTRRKLRFDLPDLSTSSVSSDKENELKEQPNQLFGVKENRTKPKSKLIVPNKIQPEPERSILQDITMSTLESFSPSDDGIASLDAMPFKCGICKQAFNCNLILMKHVKRIHGRITLKPRYRCGLCRAKFYRNSYLMKHNRLHSKPKCLGPYVYYKPV